MKKAALITGASSGIGAATAIEFAKNGYFVYLMGRDKERLAEVAIQCRSGASIMSCDITDTKAVDKRLNEMLTTKIHKIEVIVNNAGIFDRHTTEEGTDDIWLKEFNVNLLGPVRITRAFFPYFKENGGGSIVNVSSTLGLRPQGPTSAYSAVKAAMVNWTSSLAIEGGAHKIRANCVCPGIVETPIHGGGSMEHMNSFQPLGRVGQPHDIAKAIYFLGSEQSSWTTGAILAVDGGINLL
ncbi:SDR family NAD(P)-dependent oxidoreductase [Bdellovibrio sp. NC01]|uniref:SDR family NAD(P)-dependent oxidoreductase n=1 Tax=Bdellovibrio sp. NC01 TaxID=2220073 RepID=UPI0011578D6D|nr:SDR family oxidoreductase [Bdellovibrio sp. NC01]QDK37777.1 SDR family NAD(P)-dependent oxidoreductase [Bdellovibrio sp. NC01]